ncbi:hypothetical protein F4827_000501 [Paraburkholderia bannensis]|uniref:DUF2946 family protein n=1 Tax=Paraburkholderia bannensis TaxID=765414 RepID=A0A7W9TSK4_9BURK|nr:MULTISPECIES: DUF2946 family protein [Paraburkholderia]MBB3255291.1 hypothetical protein [Paraburkholderia sp. WP4_3_2]MBB6100697.1 hypothetical protein [Paraburkholderia bannensis]
MDDIVKQALARWPNVPHCSGWLRLDARGHWRLRDEADQLQGAPGTPVRHEALNAFISRNYERGADGQWYFQNGPQRVYVELEYTPWVVRLAKAQDGALELTDHTGNAFEPAAVYIDEQGSVLFAASAPSSNPAHSRVALLHDHDLDAFSQHATLDDDGESGTFHWRADADLPLQAIARADVPARFGFVQSPEQKEKAEKAQG